MSGPIERKRGKWGFPMSSGNKGVWERLLFVWVKHEENVCECVSLPSIAGAKRLVAT